MDASSSRSSKRGKSAGSTSTGVAAARQVVVLILIAAWAFVAASLIGFDKLDPPTHLTSTPNEPIANWCGRFGAFVAYHIIHWLGYAAHILAAVVGLGLLSAATGQGVKHPIVRTLGLMMLAACLAGVQQLIFPTSGPMQPAGGIIGLNIAEALRPSLGAFFAIVFLLIGALLGALVAMDEWVIAIVSWSWRFTRERGAPAAAAVGAATGQVALAAGAAAAKSTAKASGGFFAGLASLFRAKDASSAAATPEVRLDDLDSQPSLATRRKGKKSDVTWKTPAGTATTATEAVANMDDGIPVARPATLRGKSVKKADELADMTDPDAHATLDLNDDENDPDIEPPMLVLDEDEEGDNEDEIAPPPAKGKKKAAAHPSPAPPAVDDEEDDDDLPGAPQVYDEAALREKIAKLPIMFGQQNKQIATDADLKLLQDTSAEPAPEGSEAPAAPPKPYQFPGLDLLENPEENFSATLESYVREQATALESAMRQYGIDGSVVGIESGPVITMYDVKLSPGTKVAAISAVSSDIARALKAINIRIVPNQEGKDTVGIEVPNAQKEKVRLKELMSQTERFSKMKLPMFLGKDASGLPLIEDLTKMPHMLIAGTTGSGKSVCMNTIIMGFLYTKKPSELKLVLVDPKMVEMSQFKDIPHLMCPVVTEMSKAAAILEWACAKMDERYELLAEAGCRDIASYNELEWDELKDRLHPSSPEEEARIPRKLPYMVFIIDELADLMMTAKEVESSIIRIAQKARAVGIHLILATQRPQANVVTGLIKSNMPARLTFKVASGMDSRIVLDHKGGELLLGQGDMLFLSPRSSKLARAQGTLVDDREIRRVVKFMKEVAAPSFERQLLQLKSGAVNADALSDEARIQASINNSSASLQAAQEDPMFPRAVEIVLETKRGSVSLLQRRLAIGYTRSSRLIDLMGIAGIISDHKGSVARDVLITLDDWNRMKQLAAEEANKKGLKVGGINADASTITSDSLFPTEVEAKPVADDSADANTSSHDSDAEAAPFDDDPVEADQLDESEDDEADSRRAI
jgi:S-DNA-T family DNA segregation ATPase FtsK/SpoIIIE